MRLFVVYFDPATSRTLAHSTGIQKGMLGIVNAFASADQEGSNAVVIAHELLHTVRRHRQVRPHDERSELS